MIYIKEYIINNVEILYLRILLNKINYDSYKDEIDYEYLKTNFRELNYLYLIVKELHENSEHDLTPDDVALAFWTKFPDADKTIYGLLLDQLTTIHVSEEVAKDTIFKQKRRKQNIRLAETAYKVAQGQENQDKLLDLIKDYDQQVDHNSGALPLSEVNLDLEVLIEKAYSEQGLRWRLDCLNKSLGSLRKGDFGFIFARPETGKTTFLASEVSHFITQSESKIVWFNNEEQGDKVGLRILQAYFGVPLDQLLSNVKGYRDKFIERTSGRIRLFESGVIHRRDVEKIVSKLNPDLVIYDQLTKIRGFDADRKDLQLGAIFEWAREIAKGNHASIGVSQADGTAEGVRYLTMEHVANAKTAVQAEADWILGIGKTRDDADAYVRYLNISKNKLFGDRDSISELKHGKFECLIEPMNARYKDIINYD